jgi:transposase
MNSLRHETNWEGDGMQGAGETQGARRTTGVSPAARPTVGAAGLRAVDPEVGPKAQRRRFSSTYKLRIIQEAAACKQPGEVAALLRREGLYASSLTKWRQLHKQGALAGLGAARGRKPDPETQQRQRIRELERENQHLRGKLRQAEVIIEVQKKVSEILGIQLAPSDEADERT